MWEEKQKQQCMICSVFWIIVMAVAIPLAVHFGTQNGGNPVTWERIGPGKDPTLWPSNTTNFLPGGNLALGASGDLLLLVELGYQDSSSTTSSGPGRVGMFQYDRGTYEFKPQKGTETDGTLSNIPAPLVNVSNTFFLQVASMSADGTTIAIGYPQGRLPEDASGNSLATGYVSVYRWENSTTTWKSLGNSHSFMGVMDNSRVYTAGFFGSATALSDDGSRLAVSITQVQGFDSSNNLNDTLSGISSFGSFSSYVQVYELYNNDQSWKPLGNLIEGTCNAGSSIDQCQPCQGSLGPGEHDFGMTLSFNSAGTRLAVGTPQAQFCNPMVAPMQGGFVRVFDYDNDDEEWKQVGPDIVLPFFNNGDTTTPAPRELGSSLSLASMADHRLAVGSSAGAVVLEYTGGNWTILDDRRFIWSSKATFQNRASGVSLISDGNQVAVSGPYSTDGGGKVEVYEWYNNVTWKQLGRTLADNTGFGTSFELASASANVLAVKGGYGYKVYQAPDW